MSYNVDTIEILNARGFSIHQADLWALRMATTADDRPESSFLDEDWEHRQRIEGGVIYPKFLWWNGDGSGHTFEKFEELLAKFDGEADVMVCWEGGDSYTGYRVRDHIVTEHKVVMALGEVVS